VHPRRATALRPYDMRLPQGGGIAFGCRCRCAKWQAGGGSVEDQGKPAKALTKRFT
jgi:hypothetical protein